MSVFAGPEISTDGLVFALDADNAEKSWKGMPATNQIISTPLSLDVYAYASGPVTTANITDSNNILRTVKRYTITSVVNTARARVQPSGLTANVSYTFSCKIKYNSANTPSPAFAIDASKGSPEGAGFNNTISSYSYTPTSLGDGWYYLTYTWVYSACPTGNCMLTYGVVTGSNTAYLNNTFDVYEEQLEVNSFASPYVKESNGIRSNTASILDLTKNNIITANSLTYASNNTFSFNGTSDFIDCGLLSSTLGSNITVCALAQISSVVSKNNLLSLNGAYNFFLPGNRLTTTNQLYWDSASGWKSGNTTAWNTNQWYHFAWTISGTSLTFYVNGVSDGTAILAGNIAPSSVSRIGLANAGEYATGSIKLVQIYNRALTAAEISQNFNALRGRYGI